MSGKRDAFIKAVENRQTPDLRSALKTSVEAYRSQRFAGDPLSRIHEQVDDSKAARYSPAKKLFWGLAATFLLVVSLSVLDNTQRSQPLSLSPGSNISPLIRQASQSVRNTVGKNLSSAGLSQSIPAIQPKSPSWETLNKQLSQIRKGV